MPLVKTSELLLLLRGLEIQRQGWMIVDDWVTDLCAVGIASPRHPERLVYLSIFDVKEDEVLYTCDIKSSAPGGWTTLEEGTAKRTDLVHVIERFLDH